MDKMPGNFVYVALIHLMFPRARIIHAVRSPVDTCFSCYATLFQKGPNFSYDLAELGRYYRRYSDLMAHWHSILPADRILDVRYEQLVDNFDPEARRLLDFCGLAWDDNCHTFYLTRRVVTTASVAQVRKPIYRSSVGRSTRFARHLDPLFRELGIERTIGAESAA